jgi:predicted DNA-binding transcriptional regulator AlpA
MTKSHSEEDALNHIFMTLDEVKGYLRVKSRTTIYRWIKDDGFPEPLKLGGERTKRWDMTEVAKWAATQRHSK